MGKKLMAQKQVQDDTDKKCFVPNCPNKRNINDGAKRNRIQFFQVPDGIEGLFWEKAVKIRKRKYGKMIDLLSSTDYMLGLNDVQKTSPKDYEYCCEVHFDIDTDIERVFNDDGTVEYRVKAGAVPQIEPKQKKRLYDEFEGSLARDSEMNHHIIKVEETRNDVAVSQSTNFQQHSNEGTTNGYVSIVDISTLTNQNDNAPQQVFYVMSAPIEQEYEFDNEPIAPMLPLTVAMMKRKSPYYMGLQRNHFLQLLELSKQKHISDVRVMVVLRKLRLNEEFEALGDLFDLDKTTTEQYFNESKHEVINLVDILCSSDVTKNCIDTKVAIKYEAPEPIILQPINECDDDELSTSSSKSSESSYAPSGSEVDTDVFSDSDESLHAEKTEECPFCNQWCTPRGLAYHLNQSHSPQSYLNKTTCGLCLQKFETNLLLRDHQRETHDGNGYGCDLCKKQYGQRSLIIRHILRCHAKLTSFLCDKCGQGFAFEYLLKRHVEDKHLRSRNHKCHLCEKAFLKSQQLKEHIRSSHTSNRPFKCEVEGCGKTFSRSNVYRNHSRVHAIDKFECDICSKQFSFKANLTTHKRNIHRLIM